MYSPKIDPLIIPKLYHQAKQRGIPMTRLVNEILSEHLSLELQPDKCAENNKSLEVYSSDQNKEAS
jgi:hypothetical protein